MVLEHYSLSALSDENDAFFFVSTGSQGEIIKIVVFSQTSEGLWNVGFGDLKKGKINDRQISNNGDFAKVLATVAAAVYRFSARYPNRSLRIVPVDFDRKRLYNHVFRRHFSEIEKRYLVVGRREYLPDEIYEPEIFYDSFELHPKLDNFELQF